MSNVQRFKQRQNVRIAWLHRPGLCPECGEMGAHWIGDAGFGWGNFWLCSKFYGRDGRRDESVLPRTTPHRPRVSLSDFAGVVIGHEIPSYQRELLDLLERDPPPRIVVMPIRRNYPSLEQMLERMDQISRYRSAGDDVTALVEALLRGEPRRE